MEGYRSTVNTGIRCGPEKETGVAQNVPVLSESRQGRSQEDPSDKLEELRVENKHVDNSVCVWSGGVPEPLVLGHICPDTERAETGGAGLG